MQSGDGKGGHEVKSYGAYTENLRQIVKDLKELGITTVAMESTGVYWLSLYLLLEEADIEGSCWLENKLLLLFSDREKDMVQVLVQ